MKKISLFILGLIICLNANAIQTTPSHFQLWSGSLSQDQWFLDFDNKSTNGVTIPGASFSCSDSALGTNANVSTFKLRVESRDPSTGAITWFATEQAATDSYDSTSLPGCNQLAISGPFSIGIANTKTSKVVLVASSISIAPAYWSWSISGSHTISAYNLTSNNGVKLWTRNILDRNPLGLGKDLGWQLLDGICAVGDFLKGDGIDEIRLVFAKFNQDGSADWSYVFLDPATGIQIAGASKTFHTNAP